MKISENLFDRIGFCNLDDCSFYENEINRWQEWLDNGNAAGLEYMKQRKKPAELLENAHGAVVCLLNYYTPESRYIARYARGKDYHYIMWEKLNALAKELGLAENEYVACCDTMPVLERALAAKAGLGWIGRNNCLINKELGSFCFIGTLLTTQHYDNPDVVRNSCGNCHKCIDNCPAGALSDHNLDCRKCLSYRTIESREPLTPEEARHGIVFGCDRCQEVCPLAMTQKETPLSFFKSDLIPFLTAKDLVSLPDEEFSKRAYGWRKKEVLLRNLRLREDKEKNGK